MQMVTISILLLALTLQLSRAFFLGDKLVNVGIASKVRTLKPRFPANYMVATTSSSEEVSQLRMFFLPLLIALLLVFT